MKLKIPELSESHLLRTNTNTRSLIMRYMCQTNILYNVKRIYTASVQPIKNYGNLTSFFLMKKKNTKLLFFKEIFLMIKIVFKNYSLERHIIR